jgi:hypothetical protein
VKKHVVIAGALVGLGLLLLFAAFTSAKSVRQHIAETYERAGSDRVEGARTDSLVYRSRQPPSETARDIADAVEPADRRVTPSGVFLRYDEDFVTITPRSGGSTIYVDDEDSGYRRGFFFLGGWWGSYSGRGEAFRGGGPGGGK